MCFSLQIIFFAQGLILMRKTKMKLNILSISENFVIEMVDLLHIVRIKGDKIMEIFSCLNSV